ncbi:hypothetical protein Tco_1213838 [Tanacetum coccineum]
MLGQDELSINTLVISTLTSLKNCSFLPTNIQEAKEAIRMFDGSSQFLVTTHHERENSPPEVVVVNDNCGVNNAYLFSQKNSPAHFTTTNGITLDVRYDFVVVHSVKAADGNDMDDPELTLLAKGLEQQSSFGSYVVIIASSRINKNDGGATWAALEKKFNDLTKETNGLLMFTLRRMHWNEQRFERVCWRVV